MATCIRLMSTALTDAQLKDLIVGKCLWVRNSVTGDRFKVIYTKEGQTIVYHIGRNANQPSEVGNVYMSGHQGLSSAYSVQNGKIVIWLQQNYSAGRLVEADRRHSPRTPANRTIWHLLQVLR